MDWKFESMSLINCNFINSKYVMLLCKSRFMLLTAQGYFASSQWETMLQSNAISHWLGASIVFNSQILVYLRCDMAFIEPRHCNKPNITYFRCILFTVLLFRSQSHCGFQAPALLVMWVPMLWQQFCLMWALKKWWNSMAIVVVCFRHISFFNHNWETVYNYTSLYCCCLYYW